MKNGTDLLLRHFIKDYQNVVQPEIRQQYGALEGWVSVVVNLILFLVKLLFGLAINSVSLVADAVHTLADVITSAVVIISFRVAGKPRDKEHPYGHGRAEQIATLIIAVLLGIVGFEFLKQSVGRFFKPEMVNYSLVVLVALLISALIKEWMYRFAKDLGERINSPALLGDAWHHRTDAFASLGVGIGLLGVLIGYPKIDAILGIMVSILIIHTGYGIGKDCINRLLGERPSDELVEIIVDCAFKVEGVLGIHGIELHEYGEQKYITAHIEVTPALDVVQAHGISDRVEKRIKETLGASILVHVEPREKHQASGAEV